MPRALWLGLVSASALFACTFGANDFELVPAAGSGGAVSSGGAGSGGASAGSGGNGEGGVAGENSACVLNTSKPLVIFTADDLHQLPVDRFTITAGTGAVFALAFVTDSSGVTPHAHALMRNIVDANQGTVRGIADLTLPGAFLFGGAWATATEIDIVGADQRGIVQLTIPLNAMGNPDLSSASNLVVTPLDTPSDCATTVRALRIVKNTTGAPSFVATCVPDATKPGSVSLWLNTPALTKTTQVGTTAVNLDNLVRLFVRNGPSGATTNLLLVGQDQTATSDFRAGSSPADLATVGAIQLTQDAGWLQEVFAAGLPVADGGVFMTVAKFHDPTMNLAPVEIWAGSIASTAYGSLTTVPPTQLQLVTSYDTAADVYFPEEWTIRNSTAYIVAEDQVAQQNVALWTVDTGGGPIQQNLPVYSSTASGDVLSDVRISPLTSADVIGWVETTMSGSSSVLAESVSCP